MGYRQDERERAVEEVPLFVPDQAQWPDGVRAIGWDEIDNLGINREGVLHWNGRVITVEKHLSLSFWQKVSAAVVTVTAALVSLSTIVQGIASYNAWACSVGWYAVCP